MSLPYIYVRAKDRAGVEAGLNYSILGNFQPIPNFRYFAKFLSFLLNFLALPNFRYRPRFGRLGWLTSVAPILHLHYDCTSTSAAPRLHLCHASAALGPRLGWAAALGFGLRMRSAACVGWLGCVCACACERMRSVALGVLCYLIWLVTGDFDMYRFMYIRLLGTRWACLVSIARTLPYP